MRDLTVKANKQIIFKTSGANVEVDKTVIDEIYSPLSHIIRNSADHGIEAPELRLQKNKPEVGTVSVSAENRGDNVVITISDDGAGLNKEKILKKAIENKLILETDIDKLNDNQIYNLIFAPGFSTAEKVTEISGRGVGMDVVKKTVEKLGGRIEIESIKDVGAKFEIILPLSASVIDGLVLKLGKNKFIFPILKIKHTLTPNNQMLKTIFSDKGLFIIFENQTIPVIKLGEFYGYFDYEKDINKCVICVIEYETKYYGILLDEILYKQKIVCRKICEQFKNICGIKAATILGDGAVGLVIEPSEIIKEWVARDRKN